MWEIIKRYRYILIIVVVGIAYLIMAEAFPKSLSRFPFYVAIFFLDLYLWRAFSKEILKKQALVKYAVILFYWLPFITAAVLSILNYFNPVDLKNNPLYTYCFGIIFIVYSAKIFSAIIILISDIVRFIKYTWRFADSKRKKKIPKSNHIDQNVISRSKFLKNLSLITGSVVLSSMLIGRFKWVSDFRVRIADIKLSKLPQALDGFKIVQLSDLHLGSWTTPTPLYELVDRVNELNADIVVFTGDLVNFSTSEALKYEDVLKQIKARYGVYTILGNHDYGDYVNWPSKEDKEQNMIGLYKFYERIGWKLLRNDHVVLKHKREKLALLGVENWGENKRFPKLGSIEEAQKGIDPSLVQVLLSHDPSHFDKIVLNKYSNINLTLSGHTHGFQFGIEIPGFRWSPAQYLYKYWAGLYKVNKQYIYVNRGAGFLGYPGRIGILPEIAEIRLLKG